MAVNDEKQNRIYLIKSGGGTRPDETPATGQTGSGANSCRISILEDEENSRTDLFLYQEEVFIFLAERRKTYGKKIIYFRVSNGGTSR